IDSDTHCVNSISSHTSTSEIYTLSLHDALPISNLNQVAADIPVAEAENVIVCGPMLITDDEIDIVSPTNSHNTSLTSRTGLGVTDRKSTRLNSSHVKISYAVFCLKKKKKQNSQG